MRSNDWANCGRGNMAQSIICATRHNPDIVKFGPAEHEHDQVCECLRYLAPRVEATTSDSREGFLGGCPSSNRSMGSFAGQMHSEDRNALNTAAGTSVPVEWRIPNGVELKLDATVLPDALGLVIQDR